MVSSELKAAIWKQSRQIVEHYTGHKCVIRSGEFVYSAPYREDKHPSMRWNYTKQPPVWVDDPADVGGDVFDFLAQCEGLDTTKDFIEIARIALKILGIPIPPELNGSAPIVPLPPQQPQQPPANGADAPPLAPTTEQPEAPHASRIHEMLAAQYSLTPEDYTETGCALDPDKVTYPITLPDGTRANKYKSIKRDANRKRKSWSDKGSNFQRGLFVVGGTAAQNNQLLIHEGEEKAIAAFRVCGLPSVSLPSGAGHFSPEQAAMVASYNPASIVICFDNDNAGREGAKNVARVIGAETNITNIKRVHWGKLHTPAAPGYDVTDCIKEHGKDVFLMLVSNAIPCRVPSAAAKAQAAKLQEESDSRALFDAENARRFALENKGKVLFVPEFKGWKAYNPDTGTWTHDTKDAIVRNLAMQTARSWWEAVKNNPEDHNLIAHARRANNLREINAAITLAWSIDGMRANAEAFDADPFRLTCANGVLDLRTAELLPHSPDNLTAKRTEVAFDADARAPRWEQFLLEIFDGQTDLAAYLQRFVGYCLTGDVREQIFMVWWGSGCNGKSLLVNTLAHLLGTAPTGYLHRADSELLLQGKGRGAGDASPERAALIGARLSICSETAEGRRLNEPLLKELTGGDQITARPLFCDPITFRPTHKAVLVTNHKPRATDDRALWRRVRLLPFTVSFEGREDRHLAEKLAAELPGILNWALMGCLAWQANGLAEPDAVRAATRDYRSAEDVLGQWLKARTKSESEAEWGAQALFSDFETWCSESGEKPISATLFGRKLEEMGFSKNPNKRPVTRRGIALRELTP